MRNSEARPERLRPDRRLGLVALLLGIVAIWGWTFVIVKDAVAIYGVAPFLAVRFVLGTLCLGAVSARHVDGRTLRIGAAIGLVLGAAFLVQTLGLANSSASNTGLITGLFVVFAPLANRLFFGVRIRRLLWAGIGTSLLGLGFLTGAGAEGFARGDLLTLACAALFGLHVALLDRYAKGHRAATLALGQVGSAAVLLLLVALAQGHLAWPPPQVWPALLITGVLASAAAYLIQTYVQQYLPAMDTAMIMLAEPLFAVLFGVWLQGDRFTPVQILGGSLMMATLIAIEWVQHRRPRGEARP